MIERTAKRIGASYIWGLANFIAGVAITAAVVGFAAGAGGLCK